MPRFFYRLFKRSSIAILIKKVEIVHCFEYFDEGNNMRGTYFVQDLYFVEGALLQFRVIFKFFNGDHFGSYLFARAGVDAAEDFAILALADLFVKGVVLDYFDHPLTSNIIIAYYILKRLSYKHRAQPYILRCITAYIKI